MFTQSRRPGLIAEADRLVVIIRDCSFQHLAGNYREVNDGKYSIPDSGSCSRLYVDYIVRRSLILRTGTPVMPSVTGAYPVTRRLFAPE